MFKNLSLFSVLLLVFYVVNAQRQHQVVSRLTKNETPTKLVKSPKTNKYQNVHCGFEDKNGNVWVGTTADGIYKYNGKFFQNFRVENGLNSNTVFSMIEDKSGLIWIGTDNGVCTYDGKIFKRIPFVSSNASNFYLFNAASSSLANKDEIYSMLQDKKGKLWFGTNSGVYCYDGNYFTNILATCKVTNKENLTLKMTQSILEDKKGNIWFSTWFEGICKFDGKSFVSYKPNNEVWFSSILEDKNGYIWAGRRGRGVCRFDGESFKNVLQNGIFDQCGTNPEFEDKAGNIWFGSEHEDMSKRESLGGLWRFDGKTFKNFTVEDGLPNISVFLAFGDKAGNLWIGTRDTGLCKYDGKVFEKF